VNALRLPGPPPCLVVGAVRGLVSEGPRVTEALRTFAPARVALGVSPEEAAGLKEHFGSPREEPWVPLSSSELAYARSLARLEEVRVPSPSFVAALRYAAEQGILAEGVEPSEETYADLFFQHVRYTELLRRTLAERSLLKSPPGAASGGELADLWEARMRRGKGSQRLAKARTEHLRAEVTRSPPGERVAVVVDSEHFEEITIALGAPARAP
jgi:hypothetical protein